MKTKVLMIGPGFEIIGGIKALCEIIVPTLEQKVDLLYFSTIRHRSPKYSGIITLRNILSAFSQYACFLSILFKFCPTIIHLHTSQGIGWLKDTFYVVAGKAFRCRVVIHVHAYSFDHFYGTRNLLVRCLTRKLFDLSDAIVSVSEQWRASLSDINSKALIFSLRNCIAVHDIIPRDKKTEDTNAVFLGAVGERKGVYDLIDAMNVLKSEGHCVTLHIAGEGDRSGDIQRANRLIDRYGLTDCCKMLGAVKGKRKTELFTNADVFVLPSYEEGLPIAILEAMAAGLAIVSTPIGGIPEVVKDGYNGFLVRPGDIKALKDKLAILQSDPKLRAIMGRRSRDMCVRDLDVKPYVDRLVKMYEIITETQKADRRFMLRSGLK